jgi:flavin-dependent dehydrogenase
VFDAADHALDGYAWDFPTVVDGQELVCRGVYRLKREGRDGREDLHAILAERLRAIGLDIDRYKNKRFAERGMERGAVVARGRAMLVGEAAGIDPVTGEGIAQAIEFGALAGAFLARTAKDEMPSVEAWNDVFRGSRLARDLRIRERFVKAFYGPPRAELESFLADCPDALYVGCQHFADVPYDAMRLAEVAVRGAAHLAAYGIARALRA